MKKLHTEIEINGTAEEVWQSLTEFEHFPEWNPFIRKAQGQIVEGETLDVFLQPPNGRGMNFKPTVVTAVAPQKFSWQGKLFIRGLFDGKHSFQIDRLDEKRVRFTHSEEFTGMLVPLIFRSLERDTRQGFEEMNQALKERVESDQGRN